MATDFYKQNGSYFTTTGQKIVNPTELQGYAKAGGKEVSMPVVPQGATKISEPSGLQGLNESQLFRQGQDIYKLPSVPKVLGSEQLTGSTPTIKPVEQTPVDLGMAGIKTGNEGLMSQLEYLNTPLPSQPKATALQQEQEKVRGEQKTAQSDILEATMSKYNAPEYTQKAQEALAIASKIEADYNNIAEQNLNLPISSRIIGGTADRIQRQKATELAGISAVAQAYQGNVDMARNIANDAVNAQYQDITTYNDNLQNQINSVYDDLTREEKVKADQLRIVINERTNEIADEKQTKLDINNLAITAAQNGADISTTQKIINSKTLGEAIINSGQYLKTAQGTTWDTFTDEKTGETKLVNKFTGDVKSIGSYNFGEQVGEIKGLPSFDTRSANPGVNRSDRNNNPGNIKVTDFNKDWDGVVGVESTPAEDGGNFLIFDTPESGINAIGQLLLTASHYQNTTAEKAIKKYNNNGTYGAKDLGLDPNRDFQTQLNQVGTDVIAQRIATAEGFTGATQTVPSEISGIVELVRTGKLTTKEALSEVSDTNKTILSQELSKLEVQKVVSSYTEEMKNRTLQSVDELLSQVNSYTVGFGVLAKGIPTSSSRSFSAQLDTLKANIAFGELTAMREASKTGGALGQVSDREGKLLQSALGALDQGQSVEQFKAQLEKIKNSINKWKQEVNTYASESGISTVDLTDLDFKF